MVSSPTTDNENIFGKMKADSSLFMRELFLVLVFSGTIWYTICTTVAKKTAQLLYGNALLIVGWTIQSNVQFCCQPVQLEGNQYGLKMKSE